VVHVLETEIFLAWHDYPVVTVGVITWSIGNAWSNLQVAVLTVNSVVCLAN